MILDAFRLAMRRMAATVTVLTLVRDGRPMGMAATAVCSLSFDPPSLLACVNRSASLHDAFAGTDHFGVNLLSLEQEDLAARFSDPRYRDARFEGIGWAMHELEVPLLIGSQASLVCRTAARFEHGTHSVLVGEVAAVEVADHVRPLIYADGGFARHLPTAG